MSFILGCLTPGSCAHSFLTSIFAFGSLLNNSRGRTRAFARFPFREFRVLNLYRKVPQILVYREIFETRKPAHVYVRTFYFPAFFVFFDNII